MPPTEHTLSAVKINGEALSIGMINPGLDGPLKAAAYVDLLLAPPDAAKIYGEPCAILNEYFSKDDLTEFSRVEKEIISSTLGLRRLMSSGSEGHAAVGNAIAHRPAVLPTLAAWLAYTPCFDDGLDPAKFKTMSLDFRDPEAAGALPLTPEQKSVKYSKAIIGSVSLLLCAGKSSKGALRECVRKHLVTSCHFRNAMLRLVALVGRWTPVPHFGGSERKKDEAQAAMRLALMAREAICAIALQHRAGLDFVDQASHPFLNCSARSLVEAIHVNSPLQLQEKGARHTDDPVTARECLETGVTLGVILLAGRYAAWPLLRWSCLTIFALPGRILRSVMRGFTAVA